VGRNSLLSLSPGSALGREHSPIMPRPRVTCCVRTTAQPVLTQVQSSRQGDSATKDAYLALSSRPRQSRLSAVEIQIRCRKMRD
jgi:hypothetical protein